MLLFFFFFIAGIGLLFGSLSTVLIDRWKNGKGGILFGRSECPKCRHRLSARELFPVLSYLFQGGKCRHCKTHISLFYPIAECLMALIFILLAGAYISNNFGNIPSPSFFILLGLGFITVVYSLYDLRYMEIPDEIMVPGIYGCFLLLIFTLIFGEQSYIPMYDVFFDRFTYSGDISSFVTDHLLGAWILYSFLYLQILLPGGWYLASKGRFRDLIELLYSYFLFPFSLIGFWKNKENEATHEKEEDIPTWVGGGDLRIALFIGLTLGSFHGIMSFAIAYIVGSIIGMVILISRNKDAAKKNQVPFGPFLAIGWLGAIVWHSEMLDIAYRILL